MRDFIINNCPIMIWLIVAIEAVFAVLLGIKYVKDRRNMTLCMLLIDLGLLLDALFIVLGSVVPEGLPESISRIRFISHGVLIPLLYPICAYGMKLSKKIVKGVWIFTAIVCVLGFAQAMVIDLEIAQVGNLLRHVSSEKTPDWADIISKVLSFGTVIPLMLAGISAWINQETPHLFLSGLLMFVFSALGPATGNSDLIFFISMIGEVLMVLFFYIYALGYHDKVEGVDIDDDGEFDID